MSGGRYYIDAGDNVICLKSGSWNTVKGTNLDTNQPMRKQVYYVKSSRYEMGELYLELEGFENCYSASAFKLYTDLGKPDLPKPPNPRLIREGSKPKSLKKSFKKNKTLITKIKKMLT